MRRKQMTTPQEVSDSHKLILIIDGNAKYGTLLAQTIREATPYHAFAVHNGHQALKMVQKVRPDLILLDKELTDMASTHVSSQLHRTSKLQDVPVLFLELHTASTKSRQHKPNQTKAEQFPNLGKLFQTIQQILT